MKLPARLLLVDDEPLILSALARLLRRSGYEVATAENGRVALGMLETSDFDLVLTDLRMPMLDGRALLVAVRAAHAALPVVVMTGYGDTSDEDLLRLGACAVLSKPSEAALIRGAVARCLERAG
jgi:DNA-binding NtrC family response regulator